MRERLKRTLDSPSLVTELFKKKNRKCLLALVILTFLFLTVLFGNTVRAANTETVKSLQDTYTAKKDPKLPDGSNPSVKTRAIRIMISGAADMSSIPFWTTDMFDAVTLNILENQPGLESELDPTGLSKTLPQITKDLITLITKDGGFIDGMAPIGLAILAIHFLIGMIELTTSDRMTIEVWIKYWAKFIIGIAAIFYAGELFDLIWKFGTAMVPFVTGLFLNSSAGSADVRLTLFKSNLVMIDNIIGDGGVVTAIFYAFSSLIFNAVTILLALILAVVPLILTITRIIEIVIRAAFLPIGIAALADDGWHGSGGRYFKKLFAVALQASIIMFICLIMRFVRLQVAAGMSGNLAYTWDNDMAMGLESFGMAIISPVLSAVALILISAAGIAAMFKSIQMANDIVGA